MADINLKFESLILWLGGILYLLEVQREKRNILILSLAVLNQKETMKILHNKQNKKQKKGHVLV